MSKFFKYFFVAMIIQVIIIATTFLLKIGDLALLPYWIPYAFLPLFMDAPEKGTASMAHPIILFCIPAMFYSIILAWIMSVIRGNKKFG